jgi:hypothetical protein
MIYLILSTASTFRQIFAKDVYTRKTIDCRNTMNFFKGLILLGAIGLSSSCTQSYKKEYFPKELASYLKECSCESEHPAAYVKRTGATIDVSKNNGRIFMNINNELLNSMVQEDTIIFGHTHSLKVDDYLLEAQLPEDEALYVKKSPGLKMEKRMFSQFPSPGIEGCKRSDFENVLYLEGKWYVKNRDAALRHVIVLLSDYEKPRVIEYGLTDRFKEKYHSAILKCEDACDIADPSKENAESIEKCEKVIRSKIELEQMVMNTYAKIWIDYYAIAFNPAKVGDYIEPSSKDFMDMVNRSGVIFMYDLGFLNK